MRIRGRPALASADILLYDDIPVTGPARTLVDIAAELGLLVETDGLRYHRTPSAQGRDALRDRTHVIAGMSPLRFTHFEIRYERHKVQTALREANAMLRRRIGFDPSPLGQMSDARPDLG